MPPRRDFVSPLWGREYLTALPSALIAVDASLNVCFMNPAAENLLGVSAPQGEGRELAALPGMTAEIGALCERVLSSGEAISLFAHELPLPFNHSVVTLHVTPVMAEGAAAQLLITIDKSEGLSRMAASERKQEITRAAGVMAAMLAHEVKNPLSGIRGAAQLLRDDIGEEQRPLAELICRETDRIRDLLDLVEVFSNGVPERRPVNIHEALQYAIGVARAGFAQHVIFKESYDPSLPPVAGHRDLLVQLFLNLIKNAAEALAGKEDSVITIGTAYRGFSRMRRSMDGEGQALPIAVSVEDNGPGIPESVQAHLFEPFVSSKEEGRGLGLAIVAKIASDLGAVVELDREFTGGTRFIVWLAAG